MQSVYKLCGMYPSVHAQGVLFVSFCLACHSSCCHVRCGAGRQSVDPFELKILNFNKNFKF